MDMDRLTRYGSTKVLKASTRKVDGVTAIDEAVGSLDVWKVVKARLVALLTTCTEYI